MHSAKKINGTKLYELARKGIEVERKPVQIVIHSIQLLTYEYPHIRICVVCGNGTYIRTLCHDIGQHLGTGAYCEVLRRTAIGDRTIEQAKTIETILDTITHSNTQ